MLLYEYGYDTQNQLVSEIHYDGNGNIAAEYSYTYDTAGNIRSETKTVGTAVVYEKEYSYTDGQWADLLTRVENKTTNTINSITYDGSGNPLSYYNGNKTYTNLTWEHGRQLKSITTGGKTYNYTYDLDGIRTQKVVDGVTHTYYTLNGKVMRESFPYNGNTIIMDFCYDELGKPFSVAYSKNGGSSYTTYFYATNAQGDVEGLFRVTLDDTTGKYKQTWYGRYTYDAWGNVTVTDASGGTAKATSLIVRNPLRYRGYYYDTETGLYYVSSRYYDPEIGRWINADNVIPNIGCEVLGYNMFAYCFNNPVNMVDYNGSWPDWIEDAWDWVNDKVIQPVVNFVKDIAEDINNFDSNNESEEKVLESNYFSSYKGVPVIRTNGDRSGSFGAIFLTRETNNRSNPEDVIRHEYGHTKQLEQLGIVNYALCIGLPSWQQWGTGEYYSKPWEITADIYGSVQSRNHSQSNIDRGFAYLEGSKIIGPLIWLYIE